jgi:hypothetical protein
VLHVQPSAMRPNTVVWLGIVLSLLGTAAYAQTPSPNVYRSLEAGKPVHAAGEIHGTIAAVDYPGGELVVRDGEQSRAIAVVPSTTIYRHGQYATLADLRRGQRVTITAFEVGGRLVAQTIRI